MGRRPVWVIEETRDLEVLLRVAGGSNHSVRFYEDELGTEEMLSLGRLEGYGLVRLDARLRGQRVIMNYRLTRKGKHAYSDALGGFEKSLPALEDQ